MKKLSIICLILCLFMLTGCDLFMQDDNIKRYDNEFVSATGKWTLLNDDDTFFTFDGTKDVMTFSYVEDGVSKYSGKFRAIYRGNGDDVATPLDFIFMRSDKQKEDWLGCYVENFESDFTQFTIFSEEEDLGMIDGTIYTHIYRISELPYKMGSYVLEGKDFKVETNDYKYASKFNIPNGTYSLSSGENLTIVMIKPNTHQLFQYKNGDVIVEGSFYISQDKNTIYLYIEHDPYTKVTKADKDNYDTTFSIHYPPDFYLRGDFSHSEYLVINDLYHHTESPTQIQDSTWVFGTYVK